MPCFRSRMEKTTIFACAPIRHVSCVLIKEISNKTQHNTYVPARLLQSSCFVRGLPKGSKHTSDKRKYHKRCVCYRACFRQQQPTVQLSCGGTVRVLCVEKPRGVKRGEGNKMQNETNKTKHEGQPCVPHVLSGIVTDERGITMPHA